jgi:hypothetical protein
MCLIEDQLLKDSSLFGEVKPLHERVGVVV